MSHTTPPPAASPEGTRTLLRLASYARPYIGLLVLVLFFAVLYTGSLTARSYLVKPIWDDLAFAQATSGGQSTISDWFSAALPGSGDAGEDRQRPPGASGTAGAAGAAGAGQSETPGAGAAPVEDSHALAESVRETLPGLLLLIVLVLTALPIGYFGREYLTQYVLGRILVDIQQQLAAKLLALPLRFHQQSRRGDTLSRVTNDATRAHMALSLLFSNTLLAGFLLFSGVAALLYVSWQLTLAIALLAPLISLILVSFGGRIRKNAERRQQSLGKVTQRLLQILSGVKVIKAFGAQQIEESAFEQENLRYFRRNMRVVRFQAFSRTVIDATNNSVVVILILASIPLVLSNTWGLTFGGLFAFLMIVQTSCYRGVKDLTRCWTRIQELAPSARRFLDLLDLETEDTEQGTGRRCDGVRQGIGFDGVCFSYGREPVLQDISFQVNAGEVVAIVGKTGSGKSTLTDLLLRFHDPQSGTIQVDGVDLRYLDREGWRAQTAIVSQEPFLFDCSIRDNIRYGRPDAGEAQVLDAARTAHVDEFIERLPEGYDTQVGEAGGRLSGGQRQRIAIARALLRNPQVLVFDEATSALDVKSERYVQQATRSLLQGRTVFLISHRMGATRDADKVLVLEGGRIAQFGRPEELLRQKGLYQELFAMHQGRQREAAGVEVDI